jgi:hypothetical protein
MARRIYTSREGNDMEYVPQDELEENILILLKRKITVR